MERQRHQHADDDLDADRDGREDRAVPDDLVEDRVPGEVDVVLEADEARRVADILLREADPAGVDERIRDERQDEDDQRQDEEVSDDGVGAEEAPERRRPRRFSATGCSRRCP
jgi:hypothetical protein